MEMKIETKTIEIVNYVAKDGKTFNAKEECEKHEEELFAKEKEEEELKEKENDERFQNMVISKPPIPFYSSRCDYDAWALHFEDEDDYLFANDYLFKYHGEPQYWNDCMREYSNNYSYPCDLVVVVENWEYMEVLGTVEKMIERYKNAITKLKGERN